MIRMIACIGKNREIGKKGGLCFNIKRDMETFKALTTENNANIVVMGENTLLSLPKQKPLKNRVNIIMCPEGHEYDDCICIHDFNQLVKFCQVLAKEYDVWICGGAMMYKSMLPYAEELVLTEVDAEDPEATAFFPEFKDEFKPYTNSQMSEDSGYRFRFMIYHREEMERDDEINR